MAVDDTTQQVLDWVNLAHSVSYRPEVQLSGGFQNGALRIRDPDRGPAVLKFTTDRSWAAVVERAAPQVAWLRGTGWPTPAWLWSGRTQSGWAYSVQELATGAAHDTIARPWLDVVLPLVDRHAGLAPAGARDWSEYDRLSVFTDVDGHAATLSQRCAAGAEFVRAATDLVRPFADVVLPTGDLVHGDFNPGNILLRDGAVTAVVDVEALGCGTRLHDLATLAAYAWLWGERGQMGVIIGHARRFAERGQLEISLVSVLLGLFEFGTRRWPTPDLEAACSAGVDLLRRLDR